MKINYIQDAGHGWFKISPDQQRTLGVSEGTFSEFSYIESDGTIYAATTPVPAGVWNGAHRAVRAGEIEEYAGPLMVMHSPRHWSDQLHPNGAPTPPIQAKPAPSPMDTPSKFGANFGGGSMYDIVRRSVCE